MTKAMTSARWLALTSALFGVALVVSGFLYTRSRLADFDRHARVIEALGNVRQTNELLSEQVLASRFGLLNEYDPITNSELALTSATGGLRNRLDVVVDVKGTLDEALLRLDGSVASRRLAVERFKTEYSVLKNSLR